MLVQPSGGGVSTSTLLFLTEQLHRQQIAMRHHRAIESRRRPAPADRAFSVDLDLIGCVTLLPFCSRWMAPPGPESRGAPR